MDEDYTMPILFTVLCLAIFVLGFSAIMSIESSSEDYSYRMFPPCNHDAPIHLEEKVTYNDDAAAVGSAASLTGWSNVVVTPHHSIKATVSGDCQYGHV